jgi:hypothetical protein
MELVAIQIIIFGFIILVYIWQRNLINELSRYIGNVATLERYGMGSASY